MKRQFVCLSLLLGLIGCVLPICAQQPASEAAPAMLSFAGTLTRSDGKPLHGTVGVNFYLYAEKQGGAPLWMETQNVHVDKTGHYTVMLGAATAQGLPAEVFVGSGPRWLAVQVSGAAEQPRTLLFSLPYGGPAIASVRANQSQEVAPGPQGVQKLPPTVHGNGVANFIPLWTDTKIIGESVMTQSGSTIGVQGQVITTGSVGVGTSTPAVNLDVFAGTQGVHAPMAQFGSKGTTDSNSILTYNGTGTTEMFQSGCAGCFVPGAQAGDGGVRVNSGKSLFLGDSANARLRLDSAGNASQPPSAGGMVKAMLSYVGGGNVITFCFNSTLSGAAASKPPCGFTVDETGVGDYIFDLGFQVRGRFFSITPYHDKSDGDPDRLSVCNDAGCIHTLTPNQLEVTTFQGGKFFNSIFWLIVY